MTSTEAGLTAGLVERALQVAPGGVNSGRRKIDPPLVLRRGMGAYLEDVDGRRFIDYHAAWGAILLGHSHPAVVEEVRRVLADRVLFGVGTTEGEIALAAKLVEHVPSVDQVLLCNSGTEATFHAIRLARAVTGREKLIKFEGCYHGFHDYVLAGSAEEGGASEGDQRAGPAKAARSRSSSGVLKAAAEQTLVCQLNDLESLERTLARHEGKVAALIIEPFPHNSASIEPKPGFLEGLRSLCDRYGTVLIFDEVITGFRHALGGYQSIAGVTPDLSTFAKAMANGLPIAAVGGKRELMERFSTRPGGDVFVGGTYNGNAVGVVAALTTIQVLERENVHDHTFALGERMRTGLREIATEADIPATVAGFGSVFVMCFMEGPLESYRDFLRNDADLFVRYRQQLVARGIFEMPDHIGCRSHISFSHTEQDVDDTLTVAREALLAVT